MLSVHVFGPKESPRAGTLKWVRVLTASIAICSATTASAEVGVQAGARGGVDVYKQDAAFAGLDVRLSFRLSPLTIAFSFDLFRLDEGESLQAIAINALYEFPLRTVRPYAGIGLGVHRFGHPEEPIMGPVVTDASGARAAVNLVGGARLDHPALWRVKPFVQITAAIGQVDLVTITGGVLIEAKRR